MYTDKSGNAINDNNNQLIRVPAISLRVVPGYTKVDPDAQVRLTDKISISGVIDNLDNSLGLTEGNPCQGEFQNDAGATSFIARPLVGRNFKVALRYKF